MDDLGIVEEIIVSKAKGPYNEFSSLSISAVPNLLQKDVLIIAANPTAKAKTEVWQNFGLVQVRESEQFLSFAACRNCKQVYTFQSAHKSGTSTLNAHLKECRGDTSNDGQRRMTQCFPAQKQKDPVSSEAKKLITEACVVLAAKDLRAFNLVSGIGFENLIRAAVNVGRNHKFAVDLSQDLIPDPKTVSRGISKKAAEVSVLVQPEIRQGALDWLIDWLSVGDLYWKEASFDWLIDFGVLNRLTFYVLGQCLSNIFRVVSLIWKCLTLFKYFSNSIWGRWNWGRDYRWWMEGYFYADGFFWR